MDKFNQTPIAIGVAAIIVFWAVFSFFFAIDASERGIVLRFGAATSRPSI